MQTPTLNGNKYVSVVVPADAERSEDLVHAAVAETLRSESAQPEAAKLYGALATSQQQLGAATRQIHALQEQDALLRQKIAALTKAVAQARRFAHHDPLTGLPNRHLLADRFDQAVARAERQQKRVALLFLDLDEFKSVNDSLGHAAGDRLLQQVAARLAACVRTSDTVCRYGGDEFVILLPEVDSRESAAATKEKIRAHLATPYVAADAAIRVTASIGMAVYPIDGKQCGDLIQQADVAMYCDKSRAPV